MVFELNSKKKVVLIAVKNNIKNFEIENLGAELYGRINYGKDSEYLVITDSLNFKQNNFISHFLHGLKLKSYKFDKYKTKKKNKEDTFKYHRK